MKGFACAVLIVGALGSGCTSGDEGDAAPPPAAERGKPEAFCPALIDFAVESAVTAAAVSPSAGPDVVNGPEFERTRELLGELVAAAPPQAEAAAPKGQDALFTAIDELRPSCTGEQTVECSDRLSELRQETTNAAFTDARGASVTEACSAPPYLAGSDECDTLALAILKDDGDTEQPILQHFAERCD